MNSITTDMTIQFTKELSVLYAEDDIELQTQTKEFLEVLFASVTVVDNGAQALELYKKEHFDIVISDIRMPLMNGIELTTQIKEINHNQCVIIVSAYNDTEYLMEFINLNIRQFIQKPIDIENMLSTLYYAAKNIVNEKKVEEYKKSLEISNRELQETNNELQSLIRILNTKLLQTSENPEELEEKSIDATEVLIETADLTKLQEIEKAIAGVSVLIALSQHVSGEKIEKLGRLLLSYADIFKRYEKFEELSQKLTTLGDLLLESPDTLVAHFSEMLSFLESSIYTLKLLREKISSREYEGLFSLIHSIKEDIDTIVKKLQGDES